MVNKINEELLREFARKAGEASSSEPIQVAVRQLIHREVIARSYKVMPEDISQVNLYDVVMWSNWEYANYFGVVRKIEGIEITVSTGRGVDLVLHKADIKDKGKTMEYTLFRFNKIVIAIREEDKLSIVETLLHTEFFKPKILGTRIDEYKHGLRPCSNKLEMLVVMVEIKETVRISVSNGNITGLCVSRQAKEYLERER